MAYPSMMDIPSYECSTSAYILKFKSHTLVAVPVIMLEILSKLKPSNAGPSPTQSWYMNTEAMNVSVTLQKL
jgi:hypothetical protein